MKFKTLTLEKTHKEEYVYRYLDLVLDEGLVIRFRGFVDLSSFAGHPHILMVMNTFCERLVVVPPRSS